MPAAHRSRSPVIHPADGERRTLARRQAPRPPVAREADLDDRPGDEPRGRHFINGLAKGLAVIQAFNDDAHALTLAEAAERTGMSRAAARRILMTLEELGFAARQGERHFVLTPRVLSLGHAYLSSMPLWTFAEPALEALVEEIGETCSIATYDDTELVFVVRIPVHRTFSYGVTIGSRLPLYCHSAGRVLLAGLNTAQLDAYFARARLKAYTPRTVTDPAVLRERVEDTARKGYAWLDSELENNIVGLSVPIYQGGRVIAALNMSRSRSPGGSSERTDVRIHLPKLRRTAERLTTSLTLGAERSRVIRIRS